MSSECVELPFPKSEISRLIMSSIFAVFEAKFFKSANEPPFVLILLYCSSYVGRLGDFIHPNAVVIVNTLKVRRPSRNAFYEM